ncbi:MAG: rhodanese-like domain-containing protein [Crocinitomicaceae bacterium]
MRRIIPTIFCVTLFFLSFDGLAQSSVKKITKNELKQKLSQSNLQILDVRTPSEYASGHISGAVNISISDADFSTAIEKLNKSNPIVVYCSGGGRSGRATEILHQAGFSEVYDLIGGYNNYILE